MAEHEITAAIAAHLHSFNHRAWSANALQYRIRAIATSQLANGVDTLLRVLDLLDVNDVVCAELLRHFQPVRRPTNHDHLGRTRALGYSKRRGADRPSALNDHRVAP